MDVIQDVNIDEIELPQEEDEDFYNNQVEPMNMD
jgi:hypothetical protein